MLPARPSCAARASGSLTFGRSGPKSAQQGRIGASAYRIFVANGPPNLDEAASPHRLLVEPVLRDGVWFARDDFPATAPCYSLEIDRVNWRYTGSQPVLRALRRTRLGESGARTAIKFAIYSRPAGQIPTNRQSRPMFERVVARLSQPQHKAAF